MYLELFINTNMWMDIYGCILLRGLKTDDRVRNSNTYVADVVIRSIPNCETEYVISPVFS